MALVVGLCGVVGVGQAQAWTSAVGISPKGPTAGLVGAGITPNGSVITGWDLVVSPRELQARIRRPNGTLSFTKEIAQPSDTQFLPQMQMEPSGTGAVFLWAGFDGSNYRVQLRTLGTNGVLGPVITATPPNKDADNPAFGIDGSGNIVLAWEDGPYIKARTISAGGTLGPVSAVSPKGEITQDPKVAVDPAGDAVIAWEDSTDAHLHAVQRQSDGTVGSVIDLGDDLGFPKLEIDASGTATFAMGDVVRRLAWTGTLGPVLQVTRGGVAGMATNGDGESLFTWSTRTDLRARSLSPSSVLGPIQRITSGDVVDSDVALNAAGDSVIGWHQFTGSRSDADVVRRAADGTLGSSHLLGSGVQEGPIVDLNSGGQAVAAWASPRSAPRIRISVDP